MGANSYSQNVCNTHSSGRKNKDIGFKLIGSSLTQVDIKIGGTGQNPCFQSNTTQESTCLRKQRKKLAFAPYSYTTTIRIYIFFFNLRVARIENSAIAECNFLIWWYKSCFLSRRAMFSKLFVHRSVNLSIPLAKNSFVVHPYVHHSCLPSKSKITTSTAKDRLQKLRITWNLLKRL